jgi:hypothetical protein
MFLEKFDQEFSEMKARKKEKRMEELRPFKKLKVRGATSTMTWEQKRDKCIRVIEQK